MPWEIGWLALAVVAGALAGRTIGRWSIASTHLPRWIKDPPVNPAGPQTPAPGRRRPRPSS